MRRLACCALSVFLVCLAAPALAQLALAVEVAPDPVSAAETPLVEVTAGNLGAGGVANVSIQLDLPAAQIVSFNQSITTGGGTCTSSGNLNVSCDAGETVTWSLGTLGPGARKTVTLAPQLFGTLLNGTAVTFDARVLAGAVVSATASESVTVQSAPSFELALDESADPVAPGGDLTYTATFSNVTVASALGTTLTLALPAGTSFVSATGGGLFAAGVVTWNLGTLSPGKGDTRRATLHVDTPATEGTMLRPVALIQAPTLLSASAESVAVIQSDSPLRLEIEAGPDPVRAAGTLDVQLSVSNVGNTTIDPILELRLGAYHVSVAQNLLTHGGVCTISGNLNTACDIRERIQWDVPPLAPGDRLTVSLPPQVFGTLINGNVLPLRAELYEGLGGQIGESRLARQSLLVHNAPTFELALDPSADPVAPGDDLTYTATFSNLTGASTLGTTLTLALPAGTSFVSATGGGLFAAGVVTWNLGTLSSGKGDTRQATVQVDTPATEGAQLRALAEIRDSAISANSARAPAVAVIQSGSPLRLEIEAGPDPVRAAGTLDVQLSVSNVGNTTIDPILELRLGAYHVGFADNLLTHGGVCTISGNLNTACDIRERIQWDVPPLAPGDRLTVSLPPQVFGTLINGNVLPLRAELYEGLGGQIGESRLARQSLLVHNAPTFELALDPSADPVAPGDDLTYTATFSNLTGASTLGTTLTLALPAGTSFVSATGGGLFAAGVVTWNLGTLSSGKGDTRQATVQVDTPATEGAQLRALAEIRDSAISANSARAPAVAVIQSGSPLRLEIEAGPDPVRAAGTLDVQLSVSNVGNTTIDPILELRLGAYHVGFADNLLTHGGVCTISGNLNTACDIRELVQWDVPPLAPGDRLTVSLPPQVFGTLINGNVLPLRAELYEGLGGQIGESRLARQSLLVHNAPTFELALDESPDPVELGAEIVYMVTFGNPTGATAVGTTLSLPLPPGTTFVSATGAGAVNAGVITWNLGNVPSGRGGKRQAIVRLGGGVGVGDLLRTVAEIQDAALSRNTARAAGVTGAQSGAPLTLSVSATPNPALAANFLSVPTTVTNVGATTLNGVVVQTRVPALVLGFAQASATGLADCTVSGNVNTSCDIRERVEWTVPSLTSGMPVALSIPPQLFGTLSNGNLVRFVSFADGSQAVATHTVRIGITEDTDGDGLSDWLDNCPRAVNVNQTDTGGVGPGSAPDGIGDACQCGDVNNDGRVTGADGTQVKRAALGLAPFGAGVGSLAAPSKCDVNGGATGDPTYHCSGVDGTLIQRASLGLSPGVLQVCLAADGN